MDDIIINIGKLLIKIITYSLFGGAAGCGIFVFLGKKWIENKFAQNLEDYRHEQQREMAKLQLQIDGLFSRMTKIHDKEIEVLPELWRKLCDTLSAVQNYVSLLTLTPDLNRIEDNELQDHLSHTDFTEYEKEKIYKSKNKNKCYHDVFFTRQTMAIRRKFAKFHHYFMSNRIFLSQDLKEQFAVIDDKMWSAIIKRQTGETYDNQNNWIKAYKSVAEEEIRPLLDKIEEMVQKRLHFELA